MRKLIFVLAITAVIAFPVFAQKKTGTLAGTVGQVKAPKEGYAISPLVIKDEGCAKDYLRAQRATGIEQRKLLAELFQYECVKQLTGIYSVAVSGSKVLAPTFRILEATLTFNITLNWFATGEEPKIGLFSDDFGAEGWLLDKAFLEISEEDMRQAIRNAKSSLKK
jgi:hypothetical protein